MAGQSPSASALPSPALNPAPQRAPLRIPASTRTRRNHGVFLLGNEVAAVYSSRREADGLGVSLTVGQGSLTVTGGMTPTQARAMARALVVAADAAEVTQHGGA